MSGGKKILDGLQDALSRNIERYTNTYTADERRMTDLERAQAKDIEDITECLQNERKIFAAKYLVLREAERVLSCLPDAMPSASSLLKLLDMVREVLADEDQK